MIASCEDFDMSSEVLQEFAAYVGLNPWEQAENYEHARQLRYNAEHRVPLTKACEVCGILFDRTAAPAGEGTCGDKCRKARRNAKRPPSAKRTPAQVARHNANKRRRRADMSPEQKAAARADINTYERQRRLSMTPEQREAARIKNLAQVHRYRAKQRQAPTPNQESPPWKP